MLLGNTLYINTTNVGATGASVISDRNYDLVFANSDTVLRFSVSPSLTNLRLNLKTVFIDGNLVNGNYIKEILNTIKSKCINTVFIDTSMLGNLAKAIKKNFPNVYIIGFFHNIEYDYFKELIKVSKKMRHYYTLQLVKKAERQLVKYADVLITLNKRDAESLNLLYKRTVDLILPTSFVDAFDKEKSKLGTNNSEFLNLLFVGSYFPPNIYAVNWFIENVLTQINRKIKLHIVGNGFENYKHKKHDARVELVGSVADLSSYYYMSDLVIAPIFHGSGMKTKVAEALMYDKPIIGTKESFQGYEIDIISVGKQSESASEYAHFISEFDKNCSYASREIFLANYSTERIRNNFYKFLYERK